MKILLTLTRNFAFTSVLVSVLVMSLSLSGVLSRGIWSQVPLLAGETTYLAQETNPEEAEAWQIFEQAKDKVVAAKRPGTTLEQQITLYEEGLSILKRLIGEYPWTELAYKLILGDEVGGIVMPSLVLEIEVLQAFKEIRDTVEAARRNPDLQERLASHEESLSELKVLLTDEYSSSELVRKLKREESVEDINILELEQEIEIIAQAIIDRDAGLKFSEGRANIAAARKRSVSLEKRLELYKEGLEIFKELIERYPSSDLAIKLVTGECVERICLQRIERALEVGLEQKVKQEFEIVRKKVLAVADIDVFSASRRELEEKQYVLEEALKVLSELMEKYPSTRLAQDLADNKKIRGIRVSELEDELSKITTTPERNFNSSQ